MKNSDYQIKIGRGFLHWECPRWHWIPGVCWWPGLDEKGNTLKTRRILAFPRWLFGKRPNVRALKAEIEKLRAQLPVEMQESTILFLECEKGHGRLTATNWVDHGCKFCEIETLKVEKLAEAERIWDICTCFAIQDRDIHGMIRAAQANA